MCKVKVRSKVKKTWFSDFPRHRLRTVNSSGLKISINTPKLTHARQGGGGYPPLPLRFFSQIAKKRRPVVFSLKKEKKQFDTFPKNDDPMTLKSRLQVTLSYLTPPASNMLKVITPLSGVPLLHSCPSPSSSSSSSSSAPRRRPASGGRRCRRIERWFGPPDIPDVAGAPLLPSLPPTPSV